MLQCGCSVEELHFLYNSMMKHRKKCHDILLQLIPSESVPYWTIQDMEKKCCKKKCWKKRQHSSCNVSHSSDTEDESVTSSDPSSNFFRYSKDFKIHELQILSGKKIQYQDGGIHISAEKVYVIVQPAVTSQHETILIIFGSHGVVQISLKFHNLSLNIKTSLDGD
ncbi:hypothetical protein BDQ17DRAFT_1333852 [Cyathus striatus]|nr:hypothetical protein BDQ17DRAFT_1333852 [Cyathus striatus]